MVIVALLLFGLSILVSIGEAYYSPPGKRWPRSTIRYVGIFGLVLIASLTGS